MYSNHPALSLVFSLRHDRRPALKAHLGSTLATLAVGCCLLFATSNSSAQQNNTIGTVAGQAPPNQMATLATIPNPSGVAEDPSGNYYVAAQYNYYVYKITPAGVLSTIAGTGIFGFSGDGGPAATAALSAPVAVAVDQNSLSIYIVDNNRIRVVTPDGNINTYAGTGKSCSPTKACGDGGPAISATLGNPQALFVDGSGNLFIADTLDNRIREVAGTPDHTITTVAGNGLTCNGPSYNCGDGGPATAPGASGARLDLPAGVATDSFGNIYIGDTRDQRIRCVVVKAGGCPNTAYPTPSVGWIVTYAGSGNFCPVPQNNCNDGQTPLNAEFHNPSGLAVDSAGNLYVADQWDNKIRVVTASICPQGTTCVTTVAGTGYAGFTGDGKKAQKAELDGPLAVILDSAGNMTIADSGNARIRHVVNSIINTVAGGGSIGDGGAATAASLANPVTVAWDASGANYYIADAAYNRIRKVAANGDISTVAGNGEPTGYIPTVNGDGGPATAATMTSPNGVAVDAAGNLYIADSFNALVRVVNTQPSSPITVLGQTIQPGDIATVAGSGLKCENPIAKCGDGQPATGSNARITYPTSVALDGQGNLYIADYYGNRIREVLNVAGPCGSYKNLNAGYLCTLAGTGTAGWNGNDIPATTALLHHPFGVAADSAGNVYIADSLNNRVRCVVGAAGGCGGSTYGVGTIVPYAFNGDNTFGGDRGPATKASMRDPLEVALDPSGNLFVGGGADLLVQRIDAVTQIVITVAGNASKPGTYGFAGDGGPSTQATLDNLGLAVNAAGNLLVDDQGNNRIRQVDLVPVAALINKKLTFPTTTVGQTSSSMTAKLANSGLADLPLSTTVLGGADPGDFNIVGSSCVTQLAPQIRCGVSVQFTPTQTGTRTATLTINTSLGAQVVTLVGTGQ